MEEIKRLKHEFPAVEIKEIPGGANLYTRKGVVTVYFRKRKYMVNQTWTRFDDMSDVVASVNLLLNNGVKLIDRIVTGDYASKEEKRAIQLGQLQKYANGTQNRVQDVINHINRKIEFGKANGMSNSNLTMLATLNQELIQYL